jgi:hypothetical protein
MSCEVFTDFNGTNNNTVAHFFFGEENIIMDDDPLNQDSNFTKEVIMLNRTDTAG